MNILSGFIFRQIMKQAELSAKDGKAKYRAYFVDTTLYAPCRDEVDATLQEAGYGDVITTE